uniref:Uncharacterized protein n=1 Tax=Magallana gigas TaxID=29159 RepID=A0A8W8HQF3_MAGGI
MDEEKSGILKCFIYKFKQHVDLSSVSETYPCVRCRLLALVHNDCTLQLVHLDPKINTGVPSLQNIKSFTWRKLKAVDSTVRDGLQFAVITGNNTLVSYRITGDPLKADPRDSYNLTEALIGAGLLKENQSLKLLDLSQQHVVLETEGLIAGLSLTLSEVKVIYKIPYDSLYQICSDILIKFNTKQLEFCILVTF